MGPGGDRLFDLVVLAGFTGNTDPGGAADHNRTGAGCDRAGGLIGGEFGCAAPPQFRDKAAAALLYHVGELVGEQAAALEGLRCVTARTKDYVLADRIGLGVN